MALYRRIRDLREDSDISQKTVAEYLGTTAQYYGRYEQGQAELPFERAIQLGKFYNVSLDYLAGLTDNKRGIGADEIIGRLNETSDKLSRSNDKLNRHAELIEKYERLSDTSKLIINSLIDELLKK